jgi:hypothetical protein
MNGTTGNVQAGPAPGPGGWAAAGAAQPAPAEGGERRPAARRGWPLFTGLGPLGALPTAPGLVRAFTVMVLAGWGMSGAADAGQLVVSEFATNVFQAATAVDGTPVYQSGGRLTELWLGLSSDRAVLRVEVWDNLPASAGVPVLRLAGPGHESGRGLGLVDALSLEWGWHPAAGLPAKSVWAVLPLREPGRAERRGLA